MTEQWLPVVGWEGFYEVSDHGRVRSVDRTIMRRNRWGQIRPVRFTGKLLAQRPDHEGRLRVQLGRGERTQTEAKVHILVLEAFVGPRPDGLDGLHWDDDRTNNTVENLRWGTHSENMQDSVRNGTHHCASKTHCKRNHEFTPENTFRQSGGGRGCRTCRRIQHTQRERERRAARNRKVVA